ncbi:hypothetical protein Tco_0845399, partial [Tanacetum coccineum]
DDDTLLFAMSYLDRQKVEVVDRICRIKAGHEIEENVVINDLVQIGFRRALFDFPSSYRQKVEVVDRICRIKAGHEIEENAVINDLVQIGFRRALFDFPSSFVCDCNYRWTTKSSDAQRSEKFKRDSLYIDKQGKLISFNHKKVSRKRDRQKVEVVDRICRIKAGHEIEENAVINDLVQIDFRRALFDFPSSFVLSIKLAVNCFLIYPRSCDCNYRWTTKSSDAQRSEKFKRDSLYIDKQGKLTSFNHKKVSRKRVLILNRYINCHLIMQIDADSSFGTLSIKLAVNCFLIYPRSCDCNYRWTTKSSDAQRSEKFKRDSLYIDKQGKLTSFNHKKVSRKRDLILIELDTSYDYFPAQTTSDEGSDHNPFQATSDESSDNNPF